MTTADVDAANSVATVKIVKDRARIHFNIATMAFFSVLMFATALSGRRAMKEGKTVSAMNVDWHKKYNETGVMGDIRAEPAPILDSTDFART